MSYATIDDLRSHLGKKVESAPTLEYAAKMLHPLPETKVVDRTEFILALVKGKRVLDFGASGALHRDVMKVARAYLGVDREDGLFVRGFDLDDVTETLLPVFDDTEVILCGEVLEHLSNPGWFLTRLRAQYPGVPVLISVPNAFSTIAQSWLKKGFENVNEDHVAWYSPKTLSVLLERAGYTTGDLYYYNGHGPTSEGMIVLAE